MHILFLGLSPSKELEKSFSSHGIRVSHEKSQLITKVDAIISQVRNEKDLEKTEEISKKHDGSWISLVIGNKEIKNPDFYAAVFNFPVKSSVWHEETWEGLFWFSIQQIIKTKAFESAIHESQEETNTLIRKLEKNLSVAEKIQESLIPNRKTALPGVQLITKYIAAPGLGGDYFDVFEIEGKNRLGILVVDSETHGMVAALLSVLLKIKVEDFKDKFKTADEFIKHLETELGDISKEELNHISLFFGILDRKTLLLEFSTSGHINPLLRRDGSVETVLPTGELTVLPLNPGDLIFLSTNGLAKVLGKTPLPQILLDESAQPSLSKLKNSLLGKIDAYTDKKKLEDDITFIEIGIDVRALTLMKPSQSR